MPLNTQMTYLSSNPEQTKEQQQQNKNRFSLSPLSSPFLAHAARAEKQKNLNNTVNKEKERENSSIFGDSIEGLRLTLSPMPTTQHTKPVNHISIKNVRTKSVAENQKVSKPNQCWKIGRIE
eukprot:UN34477